MFSGLLYCADCGSRMTFHRETIQSPDSCNFCCGNYRSSTSSCSMHYIRNVAVERIVLENLKEVIHYVSNYEDEFVRMVMDAGMRQKDRELVHVHVRNLKYLVRLVVYICPLPQGRNRHAYNRRLTKQGI